MHLRARPGKVPGPEDLLSSLRSMVSRNFRWRSSSFLASEQAVCTRDPAEPIQSTAAAWRIIGAPRPRMGNEFQPAFKMAHPAGRNPETAEGAERSGRLPV